MPIVPGDEGPLNAVLRHWKQSGWVGVDLFFVLSGFLIGGLLFREYRKYGALSFPRFFVRRGLKIYPPFIALVVATIVVRICTAEPMRWRDVLGEFLFLQNYLGKMWIHTWSLAVEEHFYLLLPLVLFILIRRNPRSRDPFARLPRLFLVLACGELCLRRVQRLVPAPPVQLFEVPSPHARADRFLDVRRARRVLISTSRTKVSAVSSFRGGD